MQRSAIHGFTACLALVLGAQAFIGHPTPTPYPLSYPSYYGNRIYIPGDNPLTVEGAALGRRLFYEKRLSANSTISCASCHLQARAFTDGRRFSIGFDGTPTKRNAMSLANALWVRNFFWDGRAAGLETQAVTPLTDPHEMGQSLDSSAGKLRESDKQRGSGSYAGAFSAAFGSAQITPERIVRALAQFERTLISADAPYDRYLQGEYRFTPLEQQGYQLFFGGSSPGAAPSTDPTAAVRSLGCANCHGGPRTLTETYHNNGLDSVFADPGRQAVTGMAYDRGRFRVVTLRNIALTGPYMHDGRFATLPEVLDHYSEHIAGGPTLSPTLRDSAGRPVLLHLTDVEKKALLAFLNTLTDSTFITDPRFSDPKIN
jgi:cytochrome c peroxidase